MNNHDGDNTDDVGKDNAPDKDLHDESISTLYRQLPDAQPSTEIDDLIRASARRAVKSGPQKKHLSFGLKQFTATAAVLVLSVGLIVQWQVHEPEKLADALSSKLPVETTPTATIPAAATPAAPAPRSSVKDTAIDNLFSDDIAAAPEADRAFAAAAKKSAPTASEQMATSKYKEKYSLEKNRAELKMLADNPAPLSAPVSVVDSAPAPAMTAAPASEPPRPELLAETAVIDKRSKGDEKYSALASAAETPARVAKAKPMSINPELQKTIRRNEMADGSAFTPAPVAPATTATGKVQETKNEASAKSIAESATAPASIPPPDYRSAMNNGDFALALRMLQAQKASDLDAATIVDRDILRLVQGSNVKLECGALDAKKIDGEKQLCDLLITVAKNRVLAAKKKTSADITPFVKNNGYRLRALVALLEQE